MLSRTVIAAAGVVVDGAEIVAETPAERAQRRLAELRRAASSVLEVLAQIYLDEDWRHLTDDAGQSFSGFTAFVQHAIGGSASNARRYRQGVETLVAPLKQLTSGGARIPVTPNDVVRLGRSGAQAVVEAAPGMLAGIREGSAQTAVLRGLLDQVIGEQAVEIGRIVESGVPEIPAVVPPPAALAAHAHGETDPWGVGAVDDGDGPPGRRVVGGADPWGSDPDGEATDDDTAYWSPAAGSACAGGGGAVRAADARGLRDVVDAVLGLDPSVAAAAAGGAGAGLAADCLAGAQRLARIAQLLKTVG